MAWFYDYKEGHFHHIVKTTPKFVYYDVVDDNIVIVRRKKPLAVARRAIRAGDWIRVRR